MSDHVLVLRTCNSNLTSWGGFQWPVSGPVEAPDWDSEPECGHGLHGLLWGEGSADYLSSDPDSKWLVVKVSATDVVDIHQKVKFPRGEVVFCGERAAAIEYLLANGAAGKAVVYSTLTGGDDSTLTGGDDSTLTGGNRSTLTGGNRSTLTGGYGSTLTGGNRSTLTGGYGSTLTGGDDSTLTGGYRSTLTGGDRSTLTGGYGSTLTGGYGSTLTGGNRSTLTGGDDSTLTGGNRSTLTGGYGSTFVVQRWNGKRYKLYVAEVKDSDGDGQLDANVPYRLNDAGEFIRVEASA